MYTIKGALRVFVKIIISVVVATFITFLCVDILPGDSATFLSGMSGTEEIERGDTITFMQRYGQWLGAFVKGDFGYSEIYGLEVGDIVWERLKITFPLAFISLCISVVFGVILGTINVVFTGRIIQKISSAIVLIALATPVVWFGIFGIYIFSIFWNFLPSGGADGWQSYILPSLALGLTQGAIFSRYVRSALQDIEHKDFIHFACLKGASKMGAYIKYGLPSVAGALLGIIGLQMGFLMTGVVVVEHIFVMPGLGDLLYQSMLSRDVSVASSVASVMVMIVVLVNVCIDVLAYAITPILRRGYDA